MKWCLSVLFILVKIEFLHGAHSLLQLYVLGWCGLTLEEGKLFFCICRCETPGLLRGSVESWHSPAVCVIFQPKLCTGDDLHGASPALGVRDVAAATEHPPPVGISPGCRMGP